VKWDLSAGLPKAFKVLQPAVSAVNATVSPGLVDKRGDLTRCVLAANDFHDAAVRCFKVCNRVGRVNDRRTEVRGQARRDKHVRNAVALLCESSRARIAIRDSIEPSGKSPGLRAPMIHHQFFHLTVSIDK